jgi:hypothetical protein
VIVDGDGNNQAISGRNNLGGKQDYAFKGKLHSKRDNIYTQYILVLTIQQRGFIGNLIF